MLQQGSAAGGHRCGDLQFWMHLLSGLRGNDAGWTLSELWGPVTVASNPACRQAGEISRVHSARAQVRRLCWIFVL